MRYAEAVAGGRRARAGLCGSRQPRAAKSAKRRGQATWKQMAPRYRLLAQERRSARRIAGGARIGDARGQSEARDRPRARALREVARGGKLSCPGIYGAGTLRLRRPCYDSAAFVNDLFEKQRWRVRRRRTRPKMRSAEWGRLRTLRDLRREAVA
ncbi:MAG: hypothetical protein R3F11_18825 [Verrucomicrobiales bacterium]